MEEDKPPLPRDLVTPLTTISHDFSNHTAMLVTADWCADNDYSSLEKLLRWMVKTNLQESIKERKMPMHTAICGPMSLVRYARPDSFPSLVVRGPGIDTEVQIEMAGGYVGVRPPRRDRRGREWPGSVAVYRRQWSGRLARAVFRPCSRPACRAIQRDHPLADLAKWGGSAVPPAQILAHLLPEEVAVLERPTPEWTPDGSGGWRSGMPAGGEWTIRLERSGLGDDPPHVYGTIVSRCRHAAVVARRDGCVITASTVTTDQMDSPEPGMYWMMDLATECQRYEEGYEAPGESTGPGRWKAWYNYDPLVQFIAGWMI